MKRYLISLGFCVLIYATLNASSSVVLDVLRRLTEFMHEELL